MARFCDRCKKPIDYVTIYHPTPELADVEGYFCRDCALVLVPEFVELCDKADDLQMGEAGFTATPALGDAEPRTLNPDDQNEDE